MFRQLHRITNPVPALVPALVLALVLAVGLAACGGEEAEQDTGPKTVVFGDLSWDSVMVHNRIAAFIMKAAWGYEASYVPGGTPIILQALRDGDVDVDMESWTQNVQDIYDEGIANGDFLDLGPNYPDSWQGWLVPRYVIEGDPERGIEPMAPDLETVFDMAEHWELFKDPEDPTKGRFFNAIAGWAVTEINETKMEAYGLTEQYNLFVSGSDAALAGSMVAAYEKGQPWFGYYWGPTWVLGKLDMYPLKEPPYDEKVWEETKACAFPSVEVNILVNADWAEDNPEAVSFFEKYETTMDLNNEFLVYMKDNQANAQQTAEWFLANHEGVWTQWVSDEVAAKVKEALTQ
jgi:glycine betaine/proline transport system substrate-binding protein